MGRAGVGGYIDFERNNRWLAAAFLGDHDGLERIRVEQLAGPDESGAGDLFGQAVLAAYVGVLPLEALAILREFAVVGTTGRHSTVNAFLAAGQPSEALALVERWHLSTRDSMRIFTTLVAHAAMAPDEVPLGAVREYAAALRQIAVGVATPGGIAGRFAVGLFDVSNGEFDDQAATPGSAPRLDGVRTG